MKVGFKHLIVPYISSFIFDCTGSALMVAIPIYAYTLGASSLDIGLIGTSGGLAYVLTSLVSGRVSDRISRKFLLLAASGLLVFVALDYSIVYNYNLLFLLEIALNLAYGMFWPSMEGFIVRHSSPLEIRAALQGFNISWSVGWIVGPLAGGLLVGNFPPSYVSFFASSLFLSGFILLVTLPRDPPVFHTGERSHSSVDQVKSSLKGYALAYGMAFIYSFTTRIETSLFPAFATDRGLEPIVIGQIILFLGLMRTIIFGLTKTIDKRLRMSLNLLGPSFLAVSMFLTFIGQASWHFALACAFLGLGSGISYFSGLSTVLGGAESTVGLRAGIFEAMIGVGSILGPFLGGLVSTIDLRYPYALATFVCFIIVLHPIRVWLLRRGKLPK